MKEPDQTIETIFNAARRGLARPRDAALAADY